MPHGPQHPPHDPAPLDGETSEQQLLTAVVELARHAVPGARWASTGVGDPAQPAASAADSAQAQAADGLQWRADEGPAADAHRTATPVVTADLTADPRWPRLAELAAGGEVRGALALPLRSGERVLGVLTVYSDVPGGIEAESDPARLDLVGEAASVLLGARQQMAELRSLAENLQVAMRSRAAIEQAKGVVAAHLGCSTEHAFEALSAVSQDRNVKLRELAALVASDPAGHELDGLLRAALAKVAARRGWAQPSG